MIEAFRLNSKVFPYLDDPKDLMERIVTLTNEYTQKYIRGMKAPRLDVKKFDKGLVPLLEKLMNSQIKKPMRKYIKIQIYRDSDTDDGMIEVKWKDDDASLLVPMPASKDGRITFH